MGGFEHLIKQSVLNAVGKCGTCGRTYSAESVEILGHQDDLYFISLSCRNCRTRGLVAALIKEQKQEATITDLTEAELAALPGKGEVVSDDVLDMHEFLQSFDGDFASLFRHSQ